MRLVARIFLSAVVLWGVARADGIDQDFDAALKLMDGIQRAIDEGNNQVGPGDLILLYGQDQDQNGMRDEEQLAMLSAILMGQYTVDGETYGTNQLNASQVASIQAGFVANKARVEVDMTLNDNSWFTGACWLFKQADLDCNLANLISNGDAAIKDGLLSFFAAYMTLGENGIVNYKGTGQDFMEYYLEQLITIALKGTDAETFTSAIKSDISVNPANYQKFGSAGTNLLGAAGNIDANTGSGTTNKEEYDAAPDREAFLTACHITPPLRITAWPANATRNTGDSHILALETVGGLPALGHGLLETQWNTVAVVAEQTVITEVRPFEPGLEFAFHYLTLPVGVATQKTTYYGVVRDSVWKRTADSADLTVNLDTNFRIVTQPEAPAEVPAGTTVELSVEVAGGNLAPVYAWYDGDTLLSEGSSNSISIELHESAVIFCEISGSNDGAAPVTLTSDAVAITVLGTEEGEGLVEGEGSPEGEGALEGAVEGEGALDGEGAEEGEGSIAEGEGAQEGVLEGEGVAEGEEEAEAVEGEEGEGEGFEEGEGGDEGEGSEEGEQDPFTALVLDVLNNYVDFDTDSDGTVEVAELIAHFQNSVPLQDILALDGNADGLVRVSELLALVGGGYVHSADTDGDRLLSLDELLRIIQLFNAGGYACAAKPGNTEDGYLPGAGEGEGIACLPHSSDFLGEPDGVIALSELLRAIQLYNLGEYHYCPDARGDDVFCIE